MPSQTATVRKFLLGIFGDEARVIDAVKALRRSGVPIHDVYTPYAVHGLDEAMGMKRSRLPVVCFFAGVFGFFFALAFESWVFTKSWPLNIGGKPFLAIPAFIPVAFEVTVLLGGLVTVAAFLARSRLYPGSRPVLPDKAVTNDRFVVAIAREDASLDATATGKMLLDCGAESVREGEVES